MGSITKEYTNFIPVSINNASLIEKVQAEIHSLPTTLESSDITNTSGFSPTANQVQTFTLILNQDVHKYTTWNILQTKYIKSIKFNCSSTHSSNYVYVKFYYSDSTFSSDIYCGSPGNGKVCNNPNVGKIVSSVRLDIFVGATTNGTVTLNSQLINYRYN